MPSSDTYTERKRTSPETRRKATIHAAGELMRWSYPEDAGDDWLPTAEQVSAKTREMYRITPSSEDIETALAEADKRRITHTAD